LPFYTTAWPLFTISMQPFCHCLPFLCYYLFTVYHSVLLPCHCLKCICYCVVTVYHSMLLPCYYLRLCHCCESFPSWSVTFCSIHRITFLSWYLCTFLSRPSQYLQYLFFAPNTRRVQAVVLARAIIPTFTVHFTAVSVYTSSTDHQTKLHCSCIHVTCGCVHTLLTDCSLQDCGLCR